MNEMNGRELTIVEMQPLSPKQLQQQVNAIQLAMRQVMKSGVHYGVIPGCGDKPALFKPGAEVLCAMFRLRPTFEIKERELRDEHREYTIITSLHDINGHIIGQGLGLCSTMEKKYRWRNSERVCPNCGKATIIKGKEEYGGGFICFAKKGGCGAKFSGTDQAITGQHVGQVENPDVADQYNTVLKMGKKRSLVDAVLTATAASDCFTQDIEDMGPVEYVDSSGSTKFGSVQDTRKPKEFRYNMEASKKFIEPGQETAIKARLKKDYGATFDKESGELVTKKPINGWDEALSINIKEARAVHDAMGDDDLPTDINPNTGEVMESYNEMPEELIRSRIANHKSTYNTPDIDEEAEAHFAGLAVEVPRNVLSKKDAKAVVEKMKKSGKVEPYVDRPIEFKENI